jgi:hypothetical protein
MLLDENNYTAGLASLRDQLAADGYEVRTKNFWQEGNPYMGVNMKLTKEGLTTELQLHTKKSAEVKDTLLHPIYESFRTTADPTVRLSLHNQMVSIASSIPRPQNYEMLVGLGEASLQTFTG